MRDYEARMRRVIAHIDAHPGAALTLDRLSALAAFSPFHFHRQFRAWAGMPLSAYVRAVRLRLAAFRLAFRPGLTVGTIARDCGYDSPEAFARLFRREMGQTPSAFRAQPDWARWREVAAPFERVRRETPDFASSAVAVMDFPETPFAGIEHCGPAEGLGETLRRFIAWRRQAGLRVSVTFNLFHADPDAEDFRMTVGAATRRAVAENFYGVRRMVIPAGRCAHLRVIGPDAALREGIGFLYGTWLARSGAELRDFPLFAQRHTLFPDVPEGEAMTDVYLPVR